MKNKISTKPTLIKNTNVNFVTFKLLFQLKKEYKHANYLDIL